ncbi:MAG: hypothetical protein QW560_01165 [Candidatus Nitrosocaldus sp.]
MVGSMLEYIKRGQLLTYIIAMDGFTSGIPGAVSRALSSQYNSNTLKEIFADLKYYHWQGSTLKWKTSDIAKCFSYLNPPTYTIDNCTIDIDSI